jgi:hypothetical protein
MIPPEALQPPLDTPLMIWAPELAPRWLPAVLKRRKGYMEPRWLVYGIFGPGESARRCGNYPYLNFQPVAWKLAEAP